MAWNVLYSAKCDAPPNHPEGAYFWFKHQPDSSGTAQHFMMGTEGGLIPAPGSVDAFGGDVVVYFDGAVVGVHRGIFNTAVTVPDGVTIDVVRIPVNGTPPVHPDKRDVFKAVIRSAIGPTAPEAGKPFEFILKWRNESNKITDFVVEGIIKQGISELEIVAPIVFDVPIGVEQQTPIMFLGDKTTVGQGQLEFNVYSNGEKLAEATEAMDFRQPEVPEPPTPPPEEPPEGEGPRVIRGTITDGLTNQKFGTGLLRPQVTFEGKIVTVQTTGIYVIDDPAYATAILSCKTPGYQDWGKWVEAPMTGTKIVDIVLWPTGTTPPPETPPEEAMTLKKQWEDFFADPDIIKAIGLTPSSIQESFSLVFNGYSIIYDMKSEPQIGDYISVGLILAGVALASIAGVAAAIGAIGSIGVGTVLAELEYTYLQIPMIASILPRIQGWLTSPKVLKSLVAAGIGLLGTDTFVKFIGEESIQTAGMGVWILIDAEDYQGAKFALDKYRVFIDNLKSQVELVGYLNPIAYNAFKNYYQAAESQANSYQQVIDQNLGLLPKDFPEVIRATVREITDGDTIEVALVAYNDNTGASYTLPEYSNTGHAVVRILGINSPEKSPKGEILCSGIDIYEVEKQFADLSRDSLRYLNDRTVLLYVDPAHQLGSFGRILAKVVYSGTDIGLKQIKDGLACGYYREDNKYVDKDLYIAETTKAKSAGVGMWKGLEEIEKEEDKIKIVVDSTPTNAKLYIDNVDIHHRTPSDEQELADVAHLLTFGTHTFKATKAGMEGSVTVDLVKGQNSPVNIILGVSAVSPPGEPEAPGADVFKINVTTTPKNSKLYLDGIDLHHRSPMNEEELARGPYYTINLFTPGQHKLMATKGGEVAEKTITVTAGDNGTHHLVLGAGMTQPPTEQPPEQILAGMGISQLEALLAAILKALGR